MTLGSPTPGAASGSKDASDVANNDHGVDHDVRFSKHWLCAPGSSSGLENLPAELRDQVIFNMPDLPTLRSLVKASPVMHAQYQSNRNSLLGACLGRELDGFFVDAYACVMSRVREIGSPRTDEKITAFLDSYGGWLSGSGPRPDMNSLDPGNVRWLAAYHVSVAQPLARRYSVWALANFKNGASSSGANEVAEGEQGLKLTRSEEIRIFRALYRYETYYHLFGRNTGTRWGGFRHHEINELFFGLFDPWEVEAVGCIEIFVRQKYTDIFKEIKADLHPTNPRFRHENGSFNPDGSFNLDLEGEDYLEGTISRGLKMTVRLLAIDNHATLVAKMQRCLTHDQNMDASLRKVLSSLAQDDRRGLSTNPPTARDEAEERRDPMEFAGDALPPNGPPFAWVLLWSSKYANIYGGYVPEPLRRWGYVMWDERRWAGLGALVTKQWESAPELVEEIERDFDWSPLDS